MSEVGEHRTLVNSYHDWKLYLVSPRAWVFRKLGYRQWEDPGPMARGNLVHHAIARFYQEGIAGAYPADPAAFAKQEVYNMANGMASIMEAWPDATSKLDRLDKSVEEAIKLATRYCETWATDYTPLAAEAEIIKDTVVCHPDLVCTNQRGEIGVVDFKTAAQPDIASFDGSMQLDLYAYMVKAAWGVDASFITYHLLQPDGVIMPIERPPNLAWGDAVYGEILGLGTVNLDYALHETRPWHRDARAYWTAEEIYMLDGLEAAERWLKMNMEYRRNHDVRADAENPVYIGV